MPTAGYVAAHVLAEEVTAAVRSLPKDQQEDAFRLYKYARSIGDRLMNTLGGLFFLAAVPASVLYMMVTHHLGVPAETILGVPIGVILAVPLGVILAVAVLVYSVRTTRRLKRELHNMVSERPDYWNPIRETLEKAVRRAGGHISESLLGRQPTITHN